MKMKTFFQIICVLWSIVRSSPTYTPSYEPTIEPTFYPTNSPTLRDVINIIIQNKAEFFFNANINGNISESNIVLSKKFEILYSDVTEYNMHNNRYRRILMDYNIVNITYKAKFEFILRQNDSISNVSNVEMMIDDYILSNDIYNTIIMDIYDEMFSVYNVSIINIEIVYVRIYGILFIKTDSNDIIPSKSKKKKTGLIVFLCLFIPTLVIILSVVVWYKYIRTPKHNDILFKEIELNNSPIPREIHKVKFMLIGTGSSGKSTIFKQLEWTRSGIMSDEIDTDKLQIQSTGDIRNHVIECIATLIIECAKFYQTDPIKYIKCDIAKVQETDPEIMKDIKLILNIHQGDSLLGILKRNWDEYNFLCDKIVPIFNLDCIQETYKHRHLFDIHDHCKYFIENASRIFRDDYIPTQSDNLKVHIRTTGLISLTYTVLDEHKEFTKYELWDTGGQRTERNKWMHQYQGVNGLIFVASLSHYKESLFEDNAVNAMHESIQVFSEEINKKYFEGITIILLLTKKDIFEESLKQGINLDVCFTNNDNWEGRQWNTKHNYDPNKYSDSKQDELYFDKCCVKAIQFIEDVYMDQDRSSNDKPLKIHTFTLLSTNDDDVKRVFNDIHALIKQNPNESKDEFSG